MEQLADALLDEYIKDKTSRIKVELKNYIRYYDGIKKFKELLCSGNLVIPSRHVGFFERYQLQYVNFCLVYDYVALCLNIEYKKISGEPKGCFVLDCNGDVLRVPARFTRLMDGSELKSVDLGLMKDSIVKVIDTELMCPKTPDKIDESFSQRFTDTGKARAMEKYLGLINEQVYT